MDYKKYIVYEIDTDSKKVKIIADFLSYSEALKYCELMNKMDGDKGNFQIYVNGDKK